MRADEPEPFACAACGTQLAYEKGHAGKPVVCPQCGAVWQSGKSETRNAKPETNPKAWKPLKEQLRRRTLSSHPANPLEGSSAKTRADVVQPASAPGSTERVFFDQDGVSVTASRFIAPGRTFVMENISSVSVGSIEPDIFWPLLMMTLGVVLSGALLMLTRNPAVSSLGVAFIVSGLIFRLRQKRSYVIWLQTAEGELEACQSDREEFVLRVVSALNNAIAAHA